VAEHQPQGNFKSLMKPLLLFLFATTLYSMKIAAQGFAWAQGFTGSTYVDAGPITADASNNIYMVGVFNGTIDVDAGPNVYNITAVGNNNMFIVKEDASGNLIWVKQFFGRAGASTTAFLFGKSISLDPQGDIYVAGDRSLIRSILIQVL
jgi:hypothetical protein